MKAILTERKEEQKKTKNTLIRRSSRQPRLANHVQCMHPAHFSRFPPFPPCSRPAAAALTGSEKPEPWRPDVAAPAHVLPVGLISNLVLCRTRIVCGPAYFVNKVSGAQEAQKRKAV